jgi:hypothetical protein
MWKRKRKYKVSVWGSKGKNFEVKNEGVKIGVELNGGIND